MSRTPSTCSSPDGVDRMQHPDAGEPVGQHDRRDLLGELLARLDVGVEVVDPVAQFLVLLPQRVDLVAQRVGDRAVEGRRTDDQPDGQREEHRRQGHDVVPKVDH